MKKTIVLNIFNDDRLEHIPHFEQWGKIAVTDGRIKDFEITVVAADRH